jgi:hypothetical protein
VAGQAAASSVRVSRSTWGSTRVSPMTGMKLVSPPQRGTACWWRWSAIPAPATEPWFIPMLKPCAPLTERTTCIAVCVNEPSSATSAGVRSV